MQYLTPNEKEQLLRAVYSEKGKHRKRNIAIFEVGLYCALRVSEIKGLKVNCYDSNRKTIFCYRLKGSRANTIKIVDLHVVKALEDYLEERAERGIESSYLFISQKGNPISRQRMDAMIKKYAASTDIPVEKRHMHVLKHTRAIDLSELDLDLDDVQFWLGHKNIANTMKYLAYTTTLKRKLFMQLSLLEGCKYEPRFFNLSEIPASGFTELADPDYVPENQDNDLLSLPNLH